MGGFDFEGLCVFVPVRITLKRDIARYAHAGMPRGEQRFTYHFMTEKSEGAAFWELPPEEFPQVAYCFTSAFAYSEPAGSIFGDHTLFEVPTGPEVWGAGGPRWEPTFVEAGMVDAGCPVCLSACMPYVLLVDRRRIGDARVPRSWEDLLSPLCAGEVVSSDFGRERPGDVSIGYLTMHGPEAVRAYAANHAFREEGMRIAARFEHGRAGIYVLPWLYARSVEHLPYAQVIWPAEGAFVMPVWVAFRRGLDSAGTALARYFLGQRYAAVTGRAGMPSCVASDDERTRRALAGAPRHRRYRWMGWDALRAVDPERVTALGGAVGDWSVR